MRSTLRREAAIADRHGRRVDLAEGVCERDIVKVEVHLPGSHLSEARESLGSVPLGNKGQLHQLHIGAWQQVLCSRVSGGYDPRQLLLGQRCVRAHLRDILHIDHVLQVRHGMGSGMKMANIVRLAVSTNRTQEANDLRADAFHGCHILRCYSLGRQELLQSSCYIQGPERRHERFVATFDLLPRKTLSGPPLAQGT